MVIDTTTPTNDGSDAFSERSAAHRRGSGAQPYLGAITSQGRLTSRDPGPTRVDQVTEGAAYT